MRERILTAGVLRATLLALSAISIAAAAVVGPSGESDLAFRVLLMGVALYVVSRILDKR